MTKLFLHSSFIAVLLFGSTGLAAQSAEPATTAQKEKLAELLDRNSQIHMLVLLDSVLCLSVEQTDQVLEILEQEWNSDWNPELESMTLRIWSSKRLKQIDSLDHGKLKTILRASQYEALKSLKDYTATDFAIVLRQKDESTQNAELDKNMNIFSKIMENKIDELSHLCTLTEKQKRVMAVASKGAIADMRRKWQRLFEDYHQDPSNKQYQDAAMLAVRETLLAQCTKDKIWQTFLGKVFNQDQVNEINAREALRTKMATKQFTHDFLIFWTQGMNLTFSQHRDLLKVLEDNISTEFSHSFEEIEKQLVEIPPENFQEILNEAQWNKFSWMINATRNRIAD